MTLDTGQSSSLVAVHLACESLRRGESSLALACGVHLNISPLSALVADSFGALSPDGLCFTFDARANGYVRGEGGGVVVLRPLADAIAAGDHVYCVIRGSAVNNDGGGDGLTAPNQPAQEEVLRTPTVVQASSGGRCSTWSCTVAPPTGRPRRGCSARRCARQREGRGSPLRVGCVKTDLGHLEGAAGIAGLVKTALAIDRREIPPSLNFRSPGPELPLEDLRLGVQTSTTSGRLRIVRCSPASARWSGWDNCHLVLGGLSAAGVEVAKRGVEDPARAVVRSPLGEDGALAWVLSAVARRPCARGA